MLKQRGRWWVDKLDWDTGIKFGWSRANFRDWHETKGRDKTEGIPLVSALNCGHVLKRAPDFLMKLSHQQFIIE